MKKMRFAVLTAVLLPGLLPPPAPAQENFNWSNTAAGGFWNTAGNWTIGAAPGAGGLSTYVINFFTNNAALLSTNNLGLAANNGFILNSLNFSNSTVTVSGSNLVFFSNGATLPTVSQFGPSNATIAASVTLSNNTIFGGSGVGTVTVSGAIGGQSGLIKAGTGMFVLSGSNTFAGGTTISNGALRLSGGANRLWPTGNVTMVAGTLDLFGTAQTVAALNGNGTILNSNATTVSTLTMGNGNASGVFTGTVSSASNRVDVTKVGTGTQTLATVTGKAGFAPTITVNGGLLVVTGNVDNAYAIGAVNSGGTLILDKASTAAVHVVNNLTVAAGGLAVLRGSGNDQIVDGANVVANGTFDLNARNEGFNQLGGAGLVTNAGAGASVMTVGMGNGTDAFSGRIVNGAAAAATVALIKTGTGTQSLSGTNTYTGGTTISAGTLQIGNNTASGAVVGTITNNATLAFGRSDTYTVSNVVIGAGAVVQNGSGTLVVPNGLPGFANYSGVLSVNTGLLQLASLGAIGTGTIAINPAGAFLNAGSYTNVNDWLNSGRIATNSAGAIALGADSAENVNLAGAGGAFSSLYLGAAKGSNVAYTGTLTPVSSNYYVGGGGGQLTFPNAGTFVDGPAGARNLVVGPGGNNAGTTVVAAANTLGGGVTVNNGAVLILGATNTFAGAAVVNSGATLQLGSGGADGAVVSGSLSNNGTLLFNRTDSIVFNNNLSGNNAGAVKQLSGSGPVTLTGTNVLGALAVGSGSAAAPFVLAGNSSNIASGVAVGATAAGVNRYGRMIVQDNAMLYDSVNFFLGDQAGNTGEVVQTGGQVTIAGQLRVGHWPTEMSTYTISGGALTLTAISAANPFTNAVAEYGGAIYLGIDGGGSLFQSGGTIAAAGLVLDNRGNSPDNIDTYTLTGGRLTLGAWGIQGNASTLLNLGGGTISASTNWTSSLIQSNENAVLTGAGGNTTFDTAGWNITISNSFSGAGGLVKANSGTLFLNGTNGYAGGTVINGGRVQFAASNSVPGSGQILANTNGAVSFNFPNVQEAVLALGRIDPASAGTIALSATNATNNIDFAAANLPNAFLGAASNVTYGGTFTPYGTDYRFGGGGGTLVYAGVIPAGNSVTIGGGGGLSVVNLTGANLNDSTVTVNGNVLRAQDGAGLSTAASLVLSGGVFESSGSFVRALGTAPNNVRIAGGTSGFSAYGAPLAVDLGGAALTWGAPDFAPAALVLNEASANANLTFLNALDLNGVGGTFNVNGTNANTAVVLMGAITDTAGTANFVKNGGGTLVLSNSTVYGGATAINGGTLRLSSGAANQLPTATAVTIANTDVRLSTNGMAVLDLNNQDQTVSALNGGSTNYGFASVNLGNGNLTVNGAGASTFAGSIAGTGGVTVAGGGTMTFAGGNHAYLGPTVVNGSSLVLSNALLDGTVSLAAGATLTAIGNGVSGLMEQYYTNGNYNFYQGQQLPASVFNMDLDVRTANLTTNTSLHGLNNSLDMAANGTGFAAPFNAAGSSVFVDRMTGKFLAPTNGLYYFGTASDDGSLLYVDGVLVASNNFAQGVTMRGGSIYLTTGLHDLEVFENNSGGNYGFSAQMALPGGITNVLGNAYLLGNGPVVGSLSGDAGTTVVIANSSLAVGQTENTSFSGNLVGVNGTLIKTGPGALLLDGTNGGFTGSTIVSWGNLRYASAGALPGAGSQITVNGGNGTQGAVAFDVAGLQNLLTTYVSRASSGTIALTPANAAENLDFSAAGAGLSNAFLGAASDLSYGGAFTPWASPTGNVYRFGGGGGMLTYPNSLVNPASLTIAGPGGVALPAGGTMPGPLTVNAYATLDLAGGNLTAGSLFGTAVNLANANNNSGILSMNGTVTNTAGGMSLLTVGGDGTSPTFVGSIGGAIALTKAGFGTLSLAAPNTYSGPTTVNGGSLSGAVPGGTPFGTGSFAHNANGTVTVAASGPTSAVPAALTIASDPGGTFTYGAGGGAVLALNRGNWTNGATLTLGNAGATPNSVLVRGGNGVLVLAPANGTANANLGVYERILVNGGVAIDAGTGMVNASIAGRGNDANQSFEFLTYNSVSGFTAAVYSDTNFAAAAATKLTIVNAVTTLAAPATAYAAKLGANLTLNSTLNIGTGAGQAGLILNGAWIFGPGSLNFGAAEGVVYANKGTAVMLAPITGSGGLDMFLQGGTVYAGATNTFTGGLRLTGTGRFVTSNLYALGTSDVYVYGDYSGGAQAWLLAAGFYTNNFHISGNGSTIDAARYGALRIASGTTLFGDVELIGDARLAGTGAGAVITNIGSIYGPYRAEFGGNGVQSVFTLLGTDSAATTLISASATLQVGTGGTAGVLSSPVVTNLAGLAFNRSDSAAFNGTLAGTGSLTNNGGGVLTLSGPSAYTGGTTINAGQIVLAGPYALGTTNAGLLTIKSGGVLDLAGNDVWSPGLTDTGGAGTLSTAMLTNSSGTPATVFLSDSSRNFGGSIGGAINFTISGGTGYQIFATNNSYLGTTQIGTGATNTGNQLEIWAPNALGSLAGTVSIATNSSLQLKSNLEGLQYAAGTMTMSNGATLSFNTSGTMRNGGWTTPIVVPSGAANFIGNITAGNPGTLTVKGGISGNGGLIVSQTNPGFTLLLPTANSFQGGVLLNAGTVGLGTNNPLGPGAVTFNGGALAAIGGDRVLTNALLGYNIATAAGSNLTFTSGIDLGPTGASRTFTVSGNVTTVTGPVTNGGALVKNGAGVLALPNANSYGGSTYVNGGAIRGEFGAGLPAATHLTLDGGAWERSVDFVDDLGLGAGQANLPGGAGGFSAYGNAVTVSLGGLATPTPLVWGADAVFNPGALILNGAFANRSLTFANALDLNGLDRTVSVLSMNPGAWAALSGPVTNGAAGTLAGLVKDGPGVLWQAAGGNLKYNGATTVAGGVLRADYGVGIPAASSNIVLNGGVWEPPSGNLVPLGTGAGQVSLTNTAGFSAYGTPLTVNFGGAGGTLTWGSPLFAPTNLVLNEYSATAGLTFANGLDLNGATRTISVNAADPGEEVLLSGIVTNFAGTGGLTKLGSGTLILSGANNINGASAVNGGTLQLVAPTQTLAAVTVNAGSALVLAGGSATLTGSLTLTSNSTVVVDSPLTMTGTAVFDVGNGAGSRATAFINTNVTVLQQLRAGQPDNQRGAGAFYQTAGTVLSGVNAGGYPLTLGDATGSYGYYRMTGGALVSGAGTGGGGFCLGYRGTAVMDILGGLVDVTSNNLYIARDASNVSGALSILNVLGGTVLGGTNAGLIMNSGTGGTYAQLTIGAGGLVNAANGNANQIVNMTGAANATNAAVINLNAGGTLIANQFAATNAGSALLNLDGGTLSANNGTVWSNAFVQAGVGVYVYGGGARLDSGSNNVTVVPALQGATGYGVVSVAITNAGGGYIGAPAVRLTGGAGTGATAIAQIDAAGLLTNLLITSAGSGYEAGDVLTATLTGGGYLSPAGAGTVTLGANANTGSLVKTGSGALLLAGTNTYGGGTFVRAGVLQFDTLAGVPGSGRNVAVDYGAALAVSNAPGYTLLSRLALNSSGTVALVANNGNALKFSSGAGGSPLPNMSLGASLGTWTNSGSLYPFGTTYRLGGGGGTLVIADDLVLGDSLVAFGSGSGGTLILGGNNNFTGGVTMGPMGVLQLTASAALGGMPEQVVVPFGATLAAGYAMDSTFLDLVSNLSSGTLALADNAIETIDFGAYNFSAASLGAAGGVWTNNGAIFPYGSTYRLGGGGGTLVLPGENALGGANGVNFFGSGSGGTVLLPTNNNFAGAVSVNFAGGIVALRTQFALGTNNPITVSAGTVFADLGATRFVVGGGYAGQQILVTGAGSLWTNSSQMIVGWTEGGSNNSFTVSNGGRLSNPNTSVVSIIGSNSAYNSVAVLGGNSLWNNGGNSVQVGIGSGGSNNTLTIDGGVATNVYSLWVGTVAPGACGNRAVITNGGALFTLGSGLNTIGGSDGANGNTVTVAGGNATWSLAGGVLAVGGAATATGSVLNVRAGGVLTNAGLVTVGGVDSAVNLSGAATVTGLALTGVNAQVNFDGGTLRAAAAGNLVYGTGSVFVQAGGAVLDSQGFSVTVSNALLDAGGGGLTKAGAGMVTLLGANTYGGGTTISNGTLRIGDGTTAGAIAGDVLDHGVLNWANPLVSTQAFGGAIGGSGSVVKSGGGLLQLDGANAYAGGTTVSGGTLRISADANLGAGGGGLSFSGGVALWATNSFTLNNRAVAVNNAAAIIVDADSVLTVTNAVGGAGGLTKQGAGALTLGGSNTFATLTHTRGLVEIAGTGSFNTAAGGMPILVGGSAAETATLFLNGGSVNLSSAATPQFIVGDSGALTGQVVQAGGVVNSLGPIRMATNSNATWAAYNATNGTINLTHTVNSYLLIGRDGVATFTQVGGTTTIQRTSTGASAAGLNIGFAATGVGTYVLDGGMLNLTNGGYGANIGLNGTGTLILTNGAVANFRNIAVGGAVGGNGAIYLSSGELRFNGLTRSTNDAVVASVGNLYWSGGVLRPFNADATISNGLPVTLTGAGTSFNTEDAFGTARTVTVATAIGESGGSYGLTKDGTGALHLLAANTYSGPTVVSNGTLRLGAAGSIVNSPLIHLVAATSTADVSAVAFHLLNGQQLKGAGTLQGGLIMDPGAQLSPGNSPGTLTVAGNLTLSTGTTNYFDLVGPGLSDQVLVSGSLNLDGIQFADFIWNPDAAVGATEQTYTLFRSGTAVLGSLGAVTNGLVGTHDAYLRVGGAANDELQLTVIPEPATWGLMALFAAAAALRRRRTESAERGARSGESGPDGAERGARSVE